MRQYGYQPDLPRLISYIAVVEDGATGATAVPLFCYTCTALAVSAEGVSVEELEHAAKPKAITEASTS